MSVIKRSFESGMQKSSQLKQNAKMYLFGLLTVAAYIFADWVGVAAWIGFNIVGDMIIMKRNGEL